MSNNAANIVPIIKLSEIDEHTPADCYKLVLDNGIELGYAVIEQVFNPKPITNLRIVIRAATLQQLEKERDVFKKDCHYFEGQAIELRRALHEQNGTGSDLYGIPKRENENGS